MITFGFAIYRKAASILRADVVKSTSNAAYELDIIGLNLALTKLARFNSSRKQAIIIFKDLTLSLSEATEIAHQIIQCRERGFNFIGIATKLNFQTMVALSACNYRFAAPLAGPIEFKVKYCYPQIEEFLRKLNIASSSVSSSSMKMASYLTSGTFPEEAKQNHKEVANKMFQNTLELLRRGVGMNVIDALESHSYIITTGIEAVEVGLLTSIAYPEQIEDLVRSVFHINSEVEIRYRSLVKKTFNNTIQHLKFNTGKVRVFPVTDWDVSPMGSLVSALIRASKASSTKGILLIINCSGGDLDTADRLWSAIKSISQRIPTLAYIHQATSAGYYVASAADRVMIASSGIVGSIGTLLFRFDVSTVLRELGIKITNVYSGDEPKLNSVFDPINEGEAGILERRAQVAHALFLKRVVTERHIASENLDWIANGYLLNAHMAVSYGLVDEIGGVFEATNNLSGLLSSSKNILFEYYRPYQTVFIRRFLSELLSHIR